MSYDTWKTRVPDTDLCTDDAEVCECPECRKWRDNREGPEPDGEAFRGGEAAAYQAEQQMAAIRLKR